LIDDAVTLKESTRTSEGGMIVISRVVDRQPRTDKPLAVLLHKAMQTPEIFRKPIGMELCSTCGDFKEYPSGFPKDSTRKRGYGYVCNKCRAKEARQEYAYQAMLEGRTVREYKQRQKAA
jgi:hypothetical protein